MTRPNPIPLLRRLAILEAISFLALLAIAMPLKYLAGNPTPVKIVGWLHGLLFAALAATLLYTHFAARWPLPRTATIFLAALLPFGPFLTDRRMKQYEREYPAQPENT